VTYNQYSVPPDYSIPNPWGPRTHNWKGGPLDEGSLYHGPIYTRPAYRLPWIQQPLQGLSVPDEAIFVAFFTNAFFVNEPSASRIEAKFQEVDINDDEALEASMQALVDCVRDVSPEFPQKALTKAQVEEVESCFAGTKKTAFLILGAFVAVVAIVAMVGISKEEKTRRKRFG